MDPFTHALSGALIARGVLPVRTAHATRADAVVLGFLAAAFPDVDVLMSHVSPLAYLHHHRGVTHSLLVLPGWALLLGWLWSRLRRRPRAFPLYTFIAGLGVGMHIVGDLVTSFGTMVFAPLTAARYAWGTTFIIDPWLTGLIVAGLAASAMFRASRAPALVALVAVCGYVGYQALQRERAIDFGVAYARSQPLEGAVVSALPRPVSPHNWMVIVATPEAYRYSFVNLRRAAPRAAAADSGFIARLDAPYLPLAMARWQEAPRLGGERERAIAEEAWRDPRFAFFRWFAAYPVLAEVTRGNPSECAWFQDLRFFTPGRGEWPFRYGMCREATDRTWRAYQDLGPQGQRLLVP